MGVFKCNSGLTCSLILTILLTLIPQYWELKIDSIQPLPSAPPTLAPPAPKTAIVEATIDRNTTLVATLLDYDIPQNMANHVADLIKPVFDVRKLRFGNPFRLEKEFDGTLRTFEYKIDDESVLKVHREADFYAAKVEKLELEARESVITTEIKSSLWEAL